DLHTETFEGFDMDGADEAGADHAGSERVKMHGGVQHYRRGHARCKLERLHPPAERVPESRSVQDHGRPVRAIQKRLRTCHLNLSPDSFGPGGHAVRAPSKVPNALTRTGRL